MDDKAKEGVRLFGAYTAGKFRVWTLAGNAKAGCRAHIMAALLGVPKVPQSKAGVNALRAELCKAVGAAGNCEAAREDDLAEKCRAGVATA